MDGLRTDNGDHCISVRYSEPATALTVEILLMLNQAVVVTITKRYALNSCCILYESGRAFHKSTTS